MVFTTMSHRQMLCERAKRESNALDFCDLVALTIALFAPGREQVGRRRRRSILFFERARVCVRACSETRLAPGRERAGGGPFEKPARACGANPRGGGEPATRVAGRANPRSREEPRADRSRRSARVASLERGGGGRAERRASAYIYIYVCICI